MRRSSVDQIGGPGVTDVGLPRFRGPATAAIRRVPYPDIPNDLWLLPHGPTTCLQARLSRCCLAPQVPCEPLPRLGAELQCYALTVGGVANCYAHGRGHFYALAAIGSAVVKTYPPVTCSA
jgi:hypothetical protein